MLTPYEKEIEHLHNIFAGVETQDSVLDFEHNGAENVLEENFSDHETFNEHNTESEEDGDSRNGEVNNSEWFSSAYSAGKQNLGRIFMLVVMILCRDYLEHKGRRKM
ncbi:hypothetical protein AVEN_160040-1 [Araneus ventricosus]|uniref:Uncharacterized protein n=1 Tax=Araneus ventricosus TaxID=182803 RepID=A0A4Y2JNL4_ARAVE|nr:hypothetical protein AVEN_160040-1 [Araneus ventricosus]